jgi:hypothetical protein
MAAEAGGVIGPGLPVKGSARARFILRIFINRPSTLIYMIEPESNSREGG